MPWKECSVVEERLRFVARLLDGEAMTDLCREFGISRKTGYKIFDRYKEHGLEARDCQIVCVRGFREGGFRFSLSCVETEASKAWSASLLGCSERSSPK